MDALVTIGEFSRLTHLSVKTLRYYHDVGLLEPADVDPRSGYRMYATAQVPTAQLILRFRDLDMPIDEVRVVLDAPDVAARDRAILGHLERMERELGRTRRPSLRCVRCSSNRRHRFRWSTARSVGCRRSPSGKELAGTTPSPGSTPPSPRSPRRCRLTASSPSARRARCTPTSSSRSRTGDVVAFVPIASDTALPEELTGRVQRFDVPAADLAIAMHIGPFSELDRTYGALGSYVAEHARVVEGPIREHYLVTADDTADPTQYRTEVCWPVARPAVGTP